MSTARASKNTPCSDFRYPREWILDIAGGESRLLRVLRRLSLEIKDRTRGGGRILDSDGIRVVAARTHGRTDSIALPT